jgi:hypothetical protein
MFTPNRLNRTGLLWYQPPQNGSLSSLYSYHPNFQLSKLTYSNGVTGTFTGGTKGMNRPTKLSYKKGGTSLPRYPSSRSSSTVIDPPHRFAVRAVP